MLQSLRRQWKLLVGFVSCFHSMMSDLKIEMLRHSWQTYTVLSFSAMIIAPSSSFFVNARLLSEQEMPVAFVKIAIMQLQSPFVQYL
jgi:hypothetical protein